MKLQHHKGALEIVRAELKSRCNEWPLHEEYYVPETLIGRTDPAKNVNIGNPYDFYLHVIDSIIKKRPNKIICNCGINTNDVVYMSFIRTFAALNGEVGSALKQIAFLGWLIEQFHITTFLTLPVGTIGATNKKGHRGSPFSLSSPLEIDPSIGDPLLCQASAKTQYLALLEALDCLGIKYGSIVPLTTLAMDCPLFLEYPSLGYWWVANPKQHIYADRVENADIEGRTQGLSKIEISSATKALFVEPPSPKDVKIVKVDGDDYFVAERIIDGVKKNITLANAIPDPIVGRMEAYTWSDVAGVRYTKSIYPTFQGVHSSAEWDESLPSWTLMPKLLSKRRSIFGENIAVIDVNQSVPVKLLDKAMEMVDREKRARFNTCQCKTTLIAEELWSFDSPQASPQIDATVGPLVFCVGPYSHDVKLLHNSLQYHLNLLEKRQRSNLFLSGIGNHDTRSVRADLIPMLMLATQLLPNSIPFIFSGQEIGYPISVNKEFGFANELQDKEISDFSLPLFNDIPMNAVEINTAKEVSQKVSRCLNLTLAIKSIFQRVNFCYKHFGNKSDNVYGYVLESSVAKLWLYISPREESITYLGREGLLFRNNQQLTPTKIQNHSLIKMSANECFLIVDARKEYADKLINAVS